MNLRDIQQRGTDTFRRLEELENRTIPDLMTCIRKISDQLTALAATQARVLMTLGAIALVNSPIGERAIDGVLPVPGEDPRSAPMADNCPDPTQQKTVNANAN